MLPFASGTCTTGLAIVAADYPQRENQPDLSFGVVELLIEGSQYSQDCTSLCGTLLQGMVRRD